MSLQTLTSQSGRKQSDNGAFADAFRFLGSFTVVLVVAEAALCLALDLPNPLTVLASVLN
jgi:hypothetical protein